jgi:hypothetical protein
MTGSGKTWGCIDMLSRVDLDSRACIIIDHKRDSSLKKLPAEKIGLRPLFLPKKGLHIVQPSMSRDDRQDVEELLVRVFQSGNKLIYVDEGHLLGPSPAIRDILVAGRDRKVNVMWISQKANWIDTFIWSQSTFYRVFRLQTQRDIKAVQENWPVTFTMPETLYSWYYDGVAHKTHYLAPSDILDNSIKRLDAQLKHTYSAI